MRHKSNVIDGVLMQDYGKYGQLATLPVWVVQSLVEDISTLGVYTRIVAAAAVDDPEGMRVTFPKAWSEETFGEQGRYREEMNLMLEIGAITKIAEFSSGKIRVQVELYPPVIKKELDSYRRPDGRLVASFS